MLKRLLLLLSMVIWPSFLMAQNVTVTGTITDNNSTIYAGGTMTVTFVNTTGQQATFGGSPVFQKVYSVTLDNTGSFSISLPPNSTASPSIQPAGTQWNFAYTSIGNYGAANANVTITGSGSISGSLSALTRITWPFNATPPPCSTGQVILSIGSGNNGCGAGGGSGTVTSVTGTTNQIDVATGTTTPVISLDPAFQFSTTAAGALTTAPFLFTGNPVTGGTGTTTVPLWYFNGGTAPTTWITSGTYFGINAVSGFAGNFIDFHINGGGSLFSVSSSNGNISTGGTVTAGSNIESSAALGANNKSQWNSASNGVWAAENFALSGFTRISLGPDTTAFPAQCPQTGTTPYLAFDVGGACTTGTFVKTAQTLQVTAADVTCGTGGTLAPCTSFTTITGLTIALPTVSTTWSFSCDLVVSQATAAAANQIGVQTATNASTNLAASGFAYTAAGTSTAGAFTGVSSTTVQSIVTFTPGATGTKLPVHVSGTIEGTSASGTTFNLQVLTGSAADLLTIYRGSACWVW